MTGDKFTHYVSLFNESDSFQDDYLFNSLEECQALVCEHDGLLENAIDGGFVSAHSYAISQGNYCWGSDGDVAGIGSRIDEGLFKGAFR